ncbi:MAG: Uma2 family endonuclease [Planctomycetes bacterium]|nr:Uma2 family endonuclease [Planctomycetota bacterium]
MSSGISPTVSVVTIDSDPPVEPMWRWSVDQYHAMIGSGVLSEDDPVELLDGWLVMKMPKNPPLCSSTAGTHDALTSVLPAEWSIRSQEPITLSTSEPEPDLVVARGDQHRYCERHPGPEDIALVVEVAAASLERDRNFKRRLYAHAGVPVYWIVNLAGSRLEVYSEPSRAEERLDYRHRREFSASDEVPLIIEGREVGRLRVRDLLPLPRE